MFNKKIFICIGILCSCLASLVFAQDAGLGQTIQINTRFHTFVGRPSWLLIIRDVDHGQNIPYLYDIERGKNFWLAFTVGRNYLITASILSFSPYTNKPYRTKKIVNFCNLESHDHIIRGRSLVITIQGNLTPIPGSYTCSVQSYEDANFTIVAPKSE